MKKLLLLSLLGLLTITTTVDARGNVNKGKKVYMKRMNKSCKVNGTEFAAKHTQDEWTDLRDSNKLNKEIKKLCPGVKLKSRDYKHLYKFLYKYASDGGIIPSCH